jgi:hypothetical protein
MVKASKHRHADYAALAGSIGYDTDNDDLDPVLACPLLSLPVPTASDEKLAKKP